ncbi:MAG: hypothetical protein KGH94_02455 [Candidatus Micrarchaeota archaeon]|nr:hypothetical protein [Candidatus Micrarchaeota archaeon]
MKSVEKKREETAHNNEDMDIGGPLALWVGLVAIAAVIQLFIFPAVPQASPLAPVMSYINKLVGYALYVPGVFVLPILAGLWIGSRSGATSSKFDTVAYRAVLNAIYISVIYLIEVFIFYIVSKTTHTSTALASVNLAGFAAYVVALPIIICLVVAPLFAIVSAARRY